MTHENCARGHHEQFQLRQHEIFQISNLTTDEVPEPTHPVSLASLEAKLVSVLLSAADHPWPSYDEGEFQDSLDEAERVWNSNGPTEVLLLA